MELFDAYGHRPSDDEAAGMYGRQRIILTDVMPNYRAGYVEYEGGTTIFCSWQQCDNAKRTAAKMRKFHKTNSYHVGMEVMATTPGVLYAKLYTFWKENRPGETWGDFYANWLNYDEEGKQYRCTEHKVSGQDWAE